MMSRCVFGCVENGDLLVSHAQSATGVQLKPKAGPPHIASIGERLESNRDLLNEGFCIPHRLHNVCVLLWRLPKDEVPFAGGGDNY